MTFSYKIIKSDKTSISSEGIEVASNIVPRLPVSKETQKSLTKKIVKTEILTEEDKLPFIKEFQLELNREKEIIIKELIENSRSEANKIREDALSKGYEDGFEKGYSEGENNALKKYNSLIERAQAVLSEAEKQAKEYLEAQRGNIIRLAGDMAEKIVNHEIDTESETLADMIKQVLQEYKKGGILIISCNRKHVRKLKENIFSLKKINSDIDYVVMENPAFEEKRIMLEYDNEIIDLGVADQVHSIVNELLNLEV